MEANRDSAPDAIPEHIVAQHVREARITVVSSHYLRSLPTPGRVREFYERSLSARSSVLVPSMLVMLALTAVVCWITIDPESTPLFVGAAVSVVLTTLVLIRRLLAVVWSYSQAAKGTNDPSGGNPPMS